MVRNFLVLGCAALAVSAFAQNAPIGTVATVNGAVTLSDGKSSSGATAGAPISHGMRVASASNGSAMLLFQDGCLVNVQASQSFVAVENMPCQARQHSVRGGKSGNTSSGSTGTSSDSTSGTGGVIALP